MWKKKSILNLNCKHEVEHAYRKKNIGFGEKTKFHKEIDYS